MTDLKQGENNEIEEKLLYNINNLSRELLNTRKQFDKYISLVNSIWTEYKEFPDDERKEALKNIYNIYNEHNIFNRTTEINLILNGLYNLWRETKENKYLNLFLDLFPDNDYQAYIFIYQFLRKPKLDSYRAIKHILGKCTDKESLNTRIRGRFWKSTKKLLLLPLIPLYIMKNYIKRKMRSSLMKKGFTDYMANEWIRMMIEDIKKEKAYSLSKKIWCFRRGFRVWRIPQYNITKDNYKELLSDRDYCYMHPINNAFVKWINDKVTMRYILTPFKEYLPEYYFHMLKRYGNRTNIIPLVDCPKSYEPSFEGIFQLLRDKGDLVFKMSSGTHGEGFRKLSYRDGVYFMNNKFCHESDIINHFKSRTAFYAITNYVTSHKDIKAIYPESTNTVRIMTINEDGISPIIASAFMRIGSSSTGVTDNVGFGGVTADVEIETGRYYNGEQIINHVINKCPVHPDTGISTEGILPHWSKVVEIIPEMCRLMPQLEYMGFDVAITDNGFIILEINVHQDLHRFPLYKQEVKDYLFKKLEIKQQRFKNRYVRI